MYDALLEEMLSVAELAGRATLRWFQDGSLGVERKADGSPVTDADRTAERIIREHLERHHPDDGIVGEEEGTTEGTSGRRWYIDPIDGTRSFIHGVPEYSTLLAVEDGDGIAAGVIHLPALDETVAAARGSGCFWNGSRTRVSTTSSLREAMLSRSEYGTTPPDLLAKLHQGPMRLSTWSDGYGYALVATGRIDAMLDPALHPWDVAPLHVIITEAGGRITDLAGRTGVDIKDTLATNGALHDELLSVLA